MSKDNKPANNGNNGNNAKTSTPTTEKIAFQTGAAKDEYLAKAINEDQGFVTLDVLKNDPGSATLYSLAQGITSSSQQVQILNSVVLSSGAVISFDDPKGGIKYDISGVSNYQNLAKGEIAVESFEYVIRMGNNGALSIAKASVEIVGENDAPTLGALDLVTIYDTPNAEEARSFEGQLVGSDVDNGAVLTYGFADTADVVDNGDGTLSVTNAYGTLTLNTATGEYSFAVNPEALDALAAGEEVPVEFGVQVTDEHGAVSNIESIQFLLVGADEAQPEIEEPGTGSDSEPLVINWGLIKDAGARYEVLNFDALDSLKLAGLTQVSDIYTVDTDGNLLDDSSAFLVLKGGDTGNSGSAGTTIEIVVVGYLDLTQDQIFG